MSKRAKEREKRKGNKARKKHVNTVLYIKYL